MVTTEKLIREHIGPKPEQVRKRVWYQRFRKLGETILAAEGSERDKLANLLEAVYELMDEAHSFGSGTMSSYAEESKNLARDDLLQESATWKGSVLF